MLWGPEGLHSQEVGAGLCIAQPEPGEKGMFGPAACPKLTFLGVLLVQSILTHILSWSFWLPKSGRVFIALLVALAQVS